MNSNFVTMTMHFLDCWIIWVFVRDEELSARKRREWERKFNYKKTFSTHARRLLVSSSSSTHRGLDVASVWILSFAIEDFLVQVDVVVVNGIVECDGDHLWHIFRRQITGNGRTVLRAEAIGKHTNRWIAWWCSIWIGFDVCERNIMRDYWSMHVNCTVKSFDKLTTRILIWTIGTVFLAVTEETTFNAIAITASQKAILTQWLIGDEQRLNFTLFVLQLAVLYRFLPVASLLLNIEKQSSWTTDRLQSLFVLEEHDVEI